MMTPVSATRPSGQLTLKDRLSRLEFVDACKLLGPRGAKLIREGANLWDIKICDDVVLGEDEFQLRLPPPSPGAANVDVTIRLADEARRRLLWNCSECLRACEHVGAA